MTDKVFEYFEEISSIPRGSGNTDAISDYCVKFAIDRGLDYVQDDAGNVIIRKAGSKGREKEDAVIIQGHMDMVNEKKPGYEHDFEKDGLELVYNGDMLYARGTTLGGDDGIAVAYALAILDDDNISHPPIEAVFTIDEEIGMLGAAVLDMSELKGKYLLNIDSEEEDTILVSCAGGMTSICNIPLKSEMISGTEVVLTVTGLKGGHSGTEIDKERGNAVIIMGRVLERLYNECKDLRITDIVGGQKDNAIVRECRSRIVVPRRLENDIILPIEQMQKILQKEYRDTDENIRITIEFGTSSEYEAMDTQSCEKVIMFLLSVPNGVQNMSKEIEGLVETSLNLGIFKCDTDKMTAKFSVRSSVAERKEAVGEKISYITGFLGGTYEVEGNYPAWEYNKKSVLREKMLDIYERMYGKRLKVEAIHAGLECGYFMNGMKDVDIVSFGPDIFDIHTTEEKMSISSVKRIYEYLIEILKEI